MMNTKPRRVLRLTALAIAVAVTPSTRGVAQVATPRVFVLRAENLRATKARIAAHDSVLMPAYAQLLTDADQAMSEGPWSVIDKRQLSPSGDRHDYMSFGP